MNIPQKKFREIVFQLLYSYDLGLSPEDDIIALLMKELSVTRKTVRQAMDRVKQIIAAKDDIDAYITQTSLSYEFHRIQSVERNVLRLGTFELLFDQEIPPKVAISESVRLARKFGTPQSASFVNAVLDALYQSKMGVKIDRSQISQSIDELIKSEEIANQASIEKDLSNDIADE